MSEKTKEQFLKELHQLLRDYDAEITAQNHWQDYPECGEDVRMTIEFNDFNIGDIDIGKWIDDRSHGGNPKPITDI